MTNFVTRTIKNGRVKINGNTYKPDEKSVKYDGRLDGTRYVFGVYTGLEDVVAMWGKEETSKILVNTAASEIINGTLPWYWWRKGSEVKCSAGGEHKKRKTEE